MEGKEGKGKNESKGREERGAVSWFSKLQTFSNLPDLAFLHVARHNHRNWLKVFPIIQGCCFPCCILNFQCVGKMSWCQNSSGLGLVDWPCDVWLGGISWLFFPVTVWRRGNIEKSTGHSSEFNVFRLHTFRWQNLQPPLQLPAAKKRPPPHLATAPPCGRMFIVRFHRISAAALSTTCHAERSRVEIIDLVAAVFPFLSGVQGKGKTTNLWSEKLVLRNFGFAYNLERAIGVRNTRVLVLVRRWWVSWHHAARLFCCCY